LGYGYGRFGYGYRAGLYRSAWANRVWSNYYGCYVCTDPAVVGTYYLDDDGAYYPVTERLVLKARTMTEE
jgi:hypothetical protein